MINGQPSCDVVVVVSTMRGIDRVIAPPQVLNDVQ